MRAAAAAGWTSHPRIQPVSLAVVDYECRVPTGQENCKRSGNVIGEGKLRKVWENV